jgi:hypothetical protein
LGRVDATTNLVVGCISGREGRGDFDDNDYVKDEEDKPLQGQGKQSGGEVDFKHDDENEGRDED